MGGSETAPIEKLILVVRGQRVILAADLAKIYGVETRVLNQAVKRNPGKISGGFHISFDSRRGERDRGFKITICDLETGREYQVSPLCFHGTRRDYGR